MSMFKPSVNSIKKSSKVVGTNPDIPEFGHRKGTEHGQPSRKSALAVKRPGRT